MAASKTKIYSRNTQTFMFCDLRKKKVQEKRKEKKRNNYTGHGRWKRTDSVVLLHGRDEQETH
jgi:hypothetical protein